MFSKVKKLALGALAFVGVGVASAQQATLPSSVTDAFTSVTAGFNELMNDYGWPLLALVAGAFVLVKIFKRVLARV